MKKYTIKTAFFTLIAAGMLAAPVCLHADDSTNSTDTATAPVTPKHSKHGLPFHGTVDAVDASAMTLTVGSRTFKVTAKTKITKDGNMASLTDGIVGEKVSGYYRTNEDGNLTASTIHFGTKAKKNKESSDSTTSTNSVSGN